jgi:hypothetical protein
MLNNFRASLKIYAGFSFIHARALGANSDA